VLPREALLHEATFAGFGAIRDRAPGHTGSGDVVAYGVALRLLGGDTARAKRDTSEG
jgi:hypothetical protein